ncbi:MAG: ankyrin repeat domain-containing protein [Planctomycetes bacterium]|nr:ankyrin repeat domain-containing protein [Planctomycetota bacterium]
MKERRARSWRSVSLRTLLLVMLGCGCALGLVGRESRQAARRAEVVQELSKATSKVEIEYVNFFGRTTNQPPPAWQAALLGENFFQHVTRVVIDDARALPEDGRLLGELRHLRSLELGDPPPQRQVFVRGPRGQITLLTDPAAGDRSKFTDRHASGLRNLRNLESVSLSGAALTDEGVACLSPRNPLQTLTLSFTSVGDGGAAHLARIKSLETIDLSHTWITDAGMIHLATLPRLKKLTLRRVMVSDLGLRTLAKSKSLESLVLQDLAITPAGVVQLATLPQLQSVKVDGVPLARGGDLLSLKSEPEANKLLAAKAEPDVFWAIDQKYPPSGLRYLRWLLEHGADPDRSLHAYRPAARPGAAFSNAGIPQTRGNYAVGGVSPLAALAVRNALAEVEILLDYGADPNRVDGSGRTALTAAAGVGDVEMIKLLLDRGAEFHVPGAQSPMCTAAACGRIEALRLLAARGADVNRPNHHGNPPLHLNLRRQPIFEMLLELGADINAVNAHGQTPLHMAAEGGDLELMTRLLNRGADPGRMNAEGETPLAIAARLGPQAIVELLQSTPAGR